MHVHHRSSAYLPRVFFEQRDRSRQHRAPFVMDFKPFRPKSDPCNRQYLPYILQQGGDGGPGNIGRQWRRQDFVTGGSEVWVYRGSRVQSPPVPVVLSVYQRGSLLDGLAMYLSCDTKKFHDNESTHILHNFWTSIHRGKLPPFPPGGATGEQRGQLPQGAAGEGVQYRPTKNIFMTNEHKIRSGKVC